MLQLFHLSRKGASTRVVAEEVVIYAFACGWIDNNILGRRRLKGALGIQPRKE